MGNVDILLNLKKGRDLAEKKIKKGDGPIFSSIEKK
jgi:hypothetical protein